MSGKPIEKNSVFEIGSLAKPLTGILLAKMVDDGQVSYDDPISKYLPLGIHENLKNITLLELATHSSGLPRMPSNFSPADPDNPYIDYHESDLHSFLLNHSELNVDTEYSNLGYGLLGYILSLASETSYDDLLRQKVLLPLQMNDSFAAVNEDTGKRLLKGHDDNLNEAAYWQYDILEAAGGVTSTPEDMMRFLKANMDLTSTEIGMAIHSSHQTKIRFVDNNMGMDISKGVSIGLGWFHQKDTDFDINWSFGRTGGFRSFIGWNKDNNRGVVIMTNSMDNPHKIGMSILTGNLQALED